VVALGPVGPLTQPFTALATDAEVGRHARATVVAFDVVLACHYLFFGHR
ncbi:uncharacterized protein METZ01_LOCUS135220, partial [marine metagenome]